MDGHITGCVVTVIDSLRCDATFTSLGVVILFAVSLDGYIDNLVWGFKFMQQTLGIQNISYLGAGQTLNTSPSILVLC